MLWSTIFFVNLILGLIAPTSYPLMFIRVGGIFLCLIYAILRFPKDHLLQLALLMTCIADVFLAINNAAEIGIFAFLIAQIVHLTRLNGPRARTPIIIFCFIIIIALLGNLTFHHLPNIYLLCGFYLAVIILNIYCSHRWYSSQPTNPYAFMAAIGFILFLACDTCTAISFLSTNHTLPTFFYTPANYLAWLFYYPSQVLISNSSTKIQSQNLPTRPSS